MSDIAKRLTELEAGVGEFIAENASARTPEDLAERYGDDPLGFVREVLKLDLWEGQERIVNAVHKEPRVLCRESTWPALRVQSPARRGRQAPCLHLERCRPDHRDS